jgi:hypothetical protein
LFGCLQGIIFQLSSLRSLDLSGTSFGHVPSLGLHPLSRLEVLDHLSLRGCEQLHPSNLMTLYLCRSLTDLDLWVWHGGGMQLLLNVPGVRSKRQPCLVRSATAREHVPVQMRYHPVAETAAYVDVWAFLLHAGRLQRY